MGFGDDSMMAPSRPKAGQEPLGSVPDHSVSLVDSGGEYGLL